MQTSTVATSRGNPAAFSAAENRILKAALNRIYAYLKDNGKIQNTTQLGKLLGVTQQTASRLLADGPSGFGRPAALKLAIMAGFDSPETLLKYEGVEEPPLPTDWPERDRAMRIARDLNYEDDVIEHVAARFADSQFKNMPARWWNDRISAEAKEREAERATVSPPSTPAFDSPASEKITPRSRRLRGSNAR